MYLPEGQRQLADGHQLEDHASRPTSAEWSIRIGMVIGFVLVLTLEVLLLMRIFLQ